MAAIHLPGPHTAHRRGLSTTLALLRLEIRRNIGLLCFPLLVVFSFALARTYLTDAIAHWSKNDNPTRQTKVILAPLTQAMQHGWPSGTGGGA